MPPKRLAIRPRAQRFVLQWHLTAKCPQKCVHCYMPEDATYQRELRDELGYEDCIKVIDDFSDTLNRWGMPTRINFTGGDPLLKKEIFDLIEYARDRDIEVGILGNPNFLTRDVATRLKELDIRTYQLSIDGLESTHDTLRRKKGLFQDTLQAIRLLEDVGIRSAVMFTVHKGNAPELLDVIDVVAEVGASVFDFARVVPIGDGQLLRDQMLDPLEYRELLLRVLDRYKELQDRGCHTIFGRKDHLWKLLYLDLGLIDFPREDDSETIYGGCGIGSHLLTVLADGTVLPCRRLPVEIGKVPRDRIGQVFINSTELNRLRNVNLMQKCSKCELLQYCRGCPAVPYGMTGDYFAPDPQCWKGIA